MRSQGVCTLSQLLPLLASLFYIFFTKTFLDDYGEQGEKGMKLKNIQMKWWREKGKLGS